jgi:hypothetical protein
MASAITSRAPLLFHRSGEVDATRRRGRPMRLPARLPVARNPYREFYDPKLGKRTANTLSTCGKSTNPFGYGAPQAADFCREQRRRITGLTHFSRHDRGRRQMLVSGRGNRRHAHSAR